MFLLDLYSGPSYPSIASLFPMDPAQSVDKAVQDVPDDPERSNGDFSQRVIQEINAAHQSYILYVLVLPEGETPQSYGHDVS